jgi:hypothetical protein
MPIPDFHELSTISSVSLGIFLQFFNEFHHASFFVYLFSVPNRVCSFDSQVDILSFSFVFCFGGNLHLFQFHTWHQFSAFLTLFELCTHNVQSTEVFQALKPSRKLTTFISQREQEKHFDFTKFSELYQSLQILGLRNFGISVHEDPTVKYS